MGDSSIDLAPPPAQVVSLGASLLQQGKVLPSFAQFATTGEDNLRVITCGSIAGLTMNIHGRFLDAVAQTTRPFNYTVPVSSTRTITTQDFPLGTGYLLNLTAFTSGATPPKVGEAFVIVQIIRGLGGATFLLGTLISGYVTNTQGLGFPGSAIVNSTDGQPCLKFQSPGNPAAGSDWTISVPTGARWQVISAFAFLACSATVANRIPTMRWSSSSAFVVGQAMIQQVITAGVTAAIGWGTAQGVPFAPNLNSQHVGLPNEVILEPGASLQTVTTNLQAADQWSGIGILVREWLEVP